jgi:putative membrane protein
MMPADARRVHPASLALRWIQALRPWLLPLAALLLFSIGDRERLVWMWLLLPTLLQSGLDHWSRRYALEPGGLWLREGLLERKERRIQASRVLHISREQPALARLLGLWELRLETDSGGPPEAVLRYVSSAESERIAQHLGLAGRGALAADEQPPQQSIGLRELLYLGLFGGRGWALAFGLWAVGNELGLLDRLPLEDFEVEVEGTHLALGLRHLWLLLALLAGVKLLALCDVCLRHGGFRLRPIGDRLEFQSGLLTRRQTRLSPARIQRAAWRAGPLDRRLGRSSLWIDAAGGERGGEQAEAAFGGALVPILREGDRGRLESWLALPPVPEPAAWRRSAPSLLRREAIEAVLLGGLLTALSTWAYGALGLMVLLVLGPLFWLYLRALRLRHGFALSAGGLWLRRGLWLEETQFLPQDKLQSARVSQGPWSRRFGLLSLHFDSAHAGGLGAIASLPGVTPAMAQEILGELGLGAPGPSWIRAAPEQPAERNSGAPHPAA